MRATVVAVVLALAAPTSALHVAPLRPRLSSLAAPRCCAAPAADEPAKFSAGAKAAELDRAFFRIAAPAFVQFAAEPIARLVDTAYLGRLSAVALGAAGAAFAAQYAIAKVCNDPLLRSTISLVAFGSGQEEESEGARAGAVSAALLLALFMGLMQALVYLALAGPILSASCVGPGTPMRAEALAYLRVCAAGAPAATIWLVVNGIFRGLGDTATPLLWALVFTALNAALDPFFIFTAGMGAAGAALGTTLAQTLALLPLLITLHRRVRGGAGATSVGGRVLELFRPPEGLAALRGALLKYTEAGGLVLVRALGKIAAYSVCAREAARLGAVASAAHSILFQLGVATTQLCESAAVATQALLAAELGSDAPRPQKRAATHHLVTRGVSAGAVAATALSAVTWFNRGAVVSGLTTDPGVRALAGATMPLVLGCQVLKGLAYPINGALMGALDWGASAVSMWVAQLSCVASIAVWSERGARALTLNNLWSTLFLLFAVQCVVGLARIASGTGPWAVLYRKDGDGEESESVAEEATAAD